MSNYCPPIDVPFVNLSKANILLLAHLTFCHIYTTTGHTVRRSTNNGAMINHWPAISGKDWSDFAIKPPMLTRSSDRRPPVFDNTTSQQIITSPGVTAYLHCRVRNLGSKVVSWIRQRDMHILTVGIFRYTNYDHYISLHKEGTDDWTLQVIQPTVADSGLYECQVNTMPKISRFVKLVVRDPYEDAAPGKSLESNPSGMKSKGRRWETIGFYEDEDLTPDVSTLIPQAPDVYVRPGGQVAITCHVIHSKSTPKNIKWLHRHQEVSYSPRKPRVRVISSLGTPNSTSTLKLLRVSKKDTGRYICDPSNSYEAYVSVHIVEESEPLQMLRNNTSSSSRRYWHLTVLACVLMIVKSVLSSSAVS